jgi:hypothetical protein
MGKELYIYIYIYTLTKTKLEEPHGRSQQTPQKQCKKVRLKK